MLPPHVAIIWHIQIQLFMSKYHLKNLSDGESCCGKKITKQTEFGEKMKSEGNFQSTSELSRVLTSDIFDHHPKTAPIFLIP